MKREERQAVNNLGGILKAYLEDYPEDALKLYKKWKRGLLTGGETIKEAVKIAIREQ